MDDIDDCIFKYLFKVNVPWFKIQEKMGDDINPVAVTGNEEMDTYNATAKSEVYWTIADIATIYSENIDFTISDINTAIDIEKYLGMFLDHWADTLENGPQYREAAPYDNLYTLSDFYRWVVQAHDIKTDENKINTYNTSYNSLMQVIRGTVDPDDVPKNIDYATIFARYHKDISSYDGEYSVENNKSETPDTPGTDGATITPIGETARGYHDRT